MSQKENKTFRLSEILELQDVRRILQHIAIFLLGLVILSGGVFLINGEYTWGLFLRNSTIGLVISIVLLQLVKANRTSLAAYTTLGLFGIWLFAVAWDGAGVRGTVYGMLVLVVIGTGLFIGRRAGYIAAFIIFLSGIILIFAGRAGLLIHMARPITDIVALLLTGVTFFIAAYMIRIAIDQVERALAKAKNEIKERINAEEEVRRLNTELQKKFEMEQQTGAIRLRLLNFSREQLANTNIHEILESTRITANELVPHDVFSPFWADEDAGLLRPMETQGHKWFSNSFQLEWHIPLGQGVIGDAALKQQAELVNQSHLDPRAIYPHGVREQITEEHSIIIPLHSDDRFIGMLVLIRRSHSAFTQDEFEIAQLLTSLAELAISNAQVFAHLEEHVAQRTAELTASQEKYKRRAHEMSLLYRLGNSLTAGQDLYSILLALQNEIIQLIPADTFLVAIYNTETDVVSFPIFFSDGNPATSQPRLLKERPGLTGAVVFGKKPIYLPDITTQAVEKYYTPVFDDNDLELHTFLGIPLVSQERIIGMLSIQSKQVDAYSPEQIQLAENIAVQAALAIDKAALLEQLQQELRERQELVNELEDKNNELERFTYTVSHDLKAPLVTIRGFLGYLEQDVQAGKADKVQHDFERITNATNKMQQLITQLLELSRAGHTLNQPELISLKIISQDAVNLVAGHIAEKSVTVTIDPSLPTVYGDSIRLTQVLQNLIDNAVKFMGDQPQPHIEIRQQKTSSNAEPVFFVRDNGIGISPQDQNRVFGLFDKLSSDAEGTGIGLALVKRIIETHGGRIWVESAGLGKGSTFYFTIPNIRK